MKRILMVGKLEKRVVKEEVVIQPVVKEVIVDTSYLNIFNARARANRDALTESYYNC